MFEQFSRERTSTVSKIQGTGLGLAIVKRIMDEIGGTIEVNSKLGEGSEFILTMPFRVLTEDEIRRHSDALLTSKSNTAGYEATREIRRMQKPGEHVPIIAVSANAFAEDIQNSIDAGMDAHIAKPIESGHLESAIRTYVKKND